jgi:hypothetical protein
MTIAAVEHDHNGARRTPITARSHKTVIVGFVDSPFRYKHRAKRNAEQA